jgi:uncharacterized membrane protein
MVTGPPEPERDGLGLALVLTVVWGIAILVGLKASGEDATRVLKALLVGAGLTVVSVAWSRVRSR